MARFRQEACQRTWPELRVLTMEEVKKKCDAGGAGVANYRDLYALWRTRDSHSFMYFKKQALLSEGERDRTYRSRPTFS